MEHSLLNEPSELGAWSMNWVAAPVEDSGVRNQGRILELLRKAWTWKRRTWLHPVAIVVVPFLVRYSLASVFA